MNEINLTLTLEEVNSVLNALGTQPYAQVHALIADIKTQGSTQLQAAQNGQERFRSTKESNNSKEKKRWLSNPLPSKTGVRQIPLCHSELFQNLE